MPKLLQLKNVHLCYGIPALFISLLLMSCSASDPASTKSKTVELANATHSPQIFYEDSSRSCGFNLIDANHSRVYTNYKDVEVWCKEPGSVLQSLKYESLGRGSETATRAHIQNVEGMLYDHVAEEVYSEGRFQKKNIARTPSIYNTIMQLRSLDPTCSSYSFIVRTADWN